tara:strand:+ start:991 stop:1200 length:210 start_codon:yes stop_codon:yes gene_type:complete
MTKITTSVRQQYEKVRESGVTNMLSFDGVLSAAIDNNYLSLAGWMSSATRAEYGDAVANGKLCEGERNA